LKHRFILILTIAAIALNFGCQGKNAKGRKVKVEAKPFNVVAIFLPLQVFTANVIGQREGVFLDRLLPASGIDPHNYSMSPQDVAKLYESDVIIINGFSFEQRFADTIGEIEDEALVVNASEGITPILYGESEDDPEHPKVDVNPHCWASPKTAITMVENIRNGLIKADPKGTEVYMANTANYIDRLKALDAQIALTLAGVPGRGIVTFHNAFDYFARDYGLDIIAVIETHPGQQPSAGELAKLANLIKESGVKVIFAEPQYPTEIADVLAKETGAEVLVLDPYGTGTFSLDGYELVWQANLKNLVKALS